MLLLRHLQASLRCMQPALSYLLTFVGGSCYVMKDLRIGASNYFPVCRWAGLADEHGDKLAAIDPHQNPNTKLTFLCAP